MALAARRAAGRELFDLTESNPTVVGLRVPEGLLAGLASPAALRYEPSPQGLLAALEAVAASYRAHGAVVDPARILLTASTSEAYSFLLALLCDPGDEVLVPAPGYPLLELLASLACVKLVPYPLAFDGTFRLDAAAVEAAVGPATRAVVVVHPGNPTGHFVQRSERAALEELCCRRGLAILSDEVFLESAVGRDPERVGSFAATPTALTFVLSGLSKVAALPQLKCGWLVAGGDRAQEALARLEVIADSFLSVGTPVQLALPGLLAAAPGLSAQLRERVAEGRAALLAARPADAPWDVLPAEGGWSAVLRVPRTRSEEEWALALLEAGVVVQPGYFYDFPGPGFLVVSLLPEAAIREPALRRLVAVLGSGQGARPP